MQAQLFLLEKEMVACVYVEIIENLIKKLYPTNDDANDDDDELFFLHGWPTKGVKPNF